jgi:hypothetical protein
MSFSMPIQCTTLMQIQSGRTVPLTGYMYFPTFQDKIIRKIEKVSDCFMRSEHNRASQMKSQETELVLEFW